VLSNLLYKNLNGFTENIIITFIEFFFAQVYVRFAEDVIISSVGWLLRNFGPYVIIFMNVCIVITVAMDW
jgi:hypothetical protein